LFNKLNQCKIKLDSLGEINESEYFEKEIENLKNKKMLQKYYKYAMITVGGVILFICYKLELIK